MSARCEHLPQERDHVSTAVIVVLVIIGAVFLTASVVWPWGILHAVRSQYAHFTVGEPPRVTEPHPDEFGGLLQSQIEELADVPAPQPHTTYRWVDRDQGLLEMPVEDAMAVWLALHGAPPPQGQPAAPAPLPAPLSTEGGTP